MTGQATGSFFFGFSQMHMQGQIQFQGEIATGGHNFRRCGIDAMAVDGHGNALVPGIAKSQLAGFFKGFCCIIAGR